MISDRSLQPDDGSLGERPVYSAAGPRADAPAPTMMNDSYPNQLLARIDELASEHREIERLIEHLEAEPVLDQIRLRRLKKRKLLLKDQIAMMRRELDPDVSA